MCRAVATRKSGAKNGAELEEEWRGQNVELGKWNVKLEEVDKKVTTGTG
jgi:hypothetical protein